MKHAPPLLLVASSALTMLPTHHTLPTLTLLLMLLRDQLSQLLVMELFPLGQLLVVELFPLDQLLEVLFLLDLLLKVEHFLLDHLWWT